MLQLKSMFNKYDFHIVTEKTKSNIKLREKYKVDYLVYGTKYHLFKYIFKFAYNILKLLHNLQQPKYTTMLKIKLTIIKSKKISWFFK